MLKKEKCIKVIMIFAVMFSMIWLGNMKAFAQSVEESNPNDSKETAQLIQASKETV